MMTLPAPSDTLVWSQDAYRQSVASVVAEFTRCFWDVPRKARMIDGSRFRLVDGNATYRVELENGLYSIYRES